MKFLSALLVGLVLLVVTPNDVSAANGKLGLNPEISLDGLFSFAQFNRQVPVVHAGGHDPKNNGFNMQQVELALGAAVDTYFRGDAFIVWALENGTLVTEVEEAFLTSLSLPGNLQLKAGQFFTSFGRFNGTHPHAWDFANKPVIQSRFFGGDGLRNPGAQISWLIPAPWYIEILYSMQNSTGATAQSFLNTNVPNSQRSVRDLLHNGRLVNSFTLSDDWTLNVGGSAITGPNTLATAPSASRKTTQIYGGDVYLKWRQGSSHQFVALQAEILKRRTHGLTKGMDDWGMYAQATYRFTQRWMTGLRYDWASDRRNETEENAFNEGARYRISPMLTFFPSEFSRFRLQYDYDRPKFLHQRRQHAAFVQWEFIIGEHGAHKF